MLRSFFIAFLPYFRCGGHGLGPVICLLALEGTLGGGAQRARLRQLILTPRHTCLQLIALGRKARNESRERGEGKRREVGVEGEEKKWCKSEVVEEIFCLFFSRPFLLLSYFYFFFSFSLTHMPFPLPSLILFPLHFPPALFFLSLLLNQTHSHSPVSSSPLAVPPGLPCSPSPFIYHRS